MRKFLLLFIILFSCNIDNEKEEKNKYQILSLLYDRLAQPTDPVFPPPPPDSLNYVFTSKDSARINSTIEKFIKERDGRRQIVAIYPQLNPYIGGSRKERGKDCSEYDEAINKLISLKDSLKIDIDKIITRRNDSIIYFKKELLDEYSRDFYKFDALISFSRVAFNEDFMKAVVVGSISHSKLAGVSVLYFLEKINDTWEVRCTKELSIS